MNGCNIVFAIPKWSVFIELALHAALAFAIVSCMSVICLHAW